VRPDDPERLLPREALGLSLLREDEDRLLPEEDDRLLLREALGFSLWRDDEERLLREALGLSLLLRDDDRLLREALGLSLRDEDRLLRLLPLEALLRPLERLLEERPEEPELRADPCELLVSPRSARSLFTVRAAISSARLPWPRFS
jgi:hypothetical protein